MAEIKIKGGFSLAEFSSDPTFATVTEILKLLKEGTKVEPISVNDEFADGSEAAALKQLKMTLRSGDLNNVAGSAYALLKAAEESQSKLYFRISGIQGQSNIHNGESLWNQVSVSGVVSTLDTVNKISGSSSVKVTANPTVGANTVLAVGITQNVIASTRKTISYWIKSSISVAAGALQLLLDNTQDCSSPITTIDMPAIAAGVWTKCSVPIVPTGNEIYCGIKQVTDLGAITINIDSIQADADNVVLKNILPAVEFEEKEPGKFSALRITGSGESDTESGLLELNA